MLTRGLGPLGPLEITPAYSTLKTVLYPLIGRVSSPCQKIPGATPDFGKTIID